MFKTMKKFTNRLFSVILMSLLVFVAASCSSDSTSSSDSISDSDSTSDSNSTSNSDSTSDLDGNQEAMEFKSESWLIDGNQIEVPAEGNTYTLECLNYTPILLSDIKIGTEYFYPLEDESGMTDFLKVDAGWVVATAENEYLTIEVLPYEAEDASDSSSRSACVTVTYADAFKSFYINQTSEQTQN